MKKLITKLLVFVLAISSSIFFMIGCDDPSSVSGENFAPSGYVQQITTNFGSVSYGEEVLSGSSKTVRGAVLSGEVGTIFDLGAISLKKTNWQGTMDTITGNPTSFIEYYYAPTVNDCEIPQIKITLTDILNRKNYLEIYVTCVKDMQGKYSDNFTFIARGNGQETYRAYLAKATSQTTVQVNLNDERATGVVKNSYVGDSASQCGYDNGALISAKGTATAPVSFVFDKEDNALYSPVTSELETDKASPKTSYVIRNFNNTYGEKVDNTDPKWLGFSSDLVNVTVKFEKATTQSKIVVTSFGGYNLSGDEVFVADDDYLPYLPTQNVSAMLGDEFEFVAPIMYTPINKKVINGSKVTFNDGATEKTITFDTKNEKYLFENKGGLVAKFFDANNKELGESKIVIGNVDFTKQDLGITSTEGASVEFGTYKQSAIDTYYTGIKLTGGDNATFNLGLVSLSDSFWNFDDYLFDYDDNDDATSFENKSIYSSLIDVVFHPNTNRTGKPAGQTSYFGELSGFYIDLVNPNNPTEFVSIYVYDYVDGDAKGSYVVKAAATNNPDYYCQRYYGQKGAIVLNQTVRRRLSPRGDQVAPIEICYDDGGVYSTATYPNTGNIGIKGAYCVRNFSYEDTEFAQNYFNLNGKLGEVTSFHRDNHEYWQGFTCDKVNVSIRFEDVREQYAKGNTTSIILTKLGRFDLTKGVADVNDDEFSVTVEESGQIKVGVETTLYAPFKMHALYKNYFVSTYAEVYFGDEPNKVDTINFIGNSVKYTFNNFGEYTLKYYDSTGAKIIEKKYSVALNMIS